MSEHTHRKSSGVAFAFGPWGEIDEGATISCVHCQFTWIMQKGSGRMRGWCPKCVGFICGPACAECVPVERRMENIEAGRPELTPAPVKIQVPDSALWGG